MTPQGVKRKVVNVSDFRLTGRVLGKGNFARVEEAVHSVLNVKVAIKIIDIREIKEKYVVRNLHREARIMSTLNHPCIAALFQTMQLADNVYYLVTELVPGGDLCSFIIGQRYGKLEERPARVYARQFASALSHMHSYGIVHRDLKMENVILNSTQTQIKIVDFGLSNVWSSESPLRTHCGSPEYAAPELFVAGREYGPEVDLWSLGIIFFGMVVGQLPFVGGRKNQLPSQERRKRLVAQINRGLGASQRQAIAPLSPEFRAMLHRLLAPDPEKRITAAELALHPWITDKGSKVVRSHPVARPDARLQAKLTEQIGALYRTDRAAVAEDICRSPFGRLGGAYNILAYKHLSEPFDPERIAVTRSPRKAKPTSAPPTKSHHALYNQCVVLLNKVSERRVGERSRSAAAAQLLAKNAARMSRSRVEQPPSGKQAKAPEGAASKTLKKTASSGQSGAEDGRPLASNVKRPHTTGAVLNAPRPRKRSGVSTALPTTGAPNSRELQRRQVCINATGRGDGRCVKKESSAASSQKIRPKDPLANDPIARSIAGFLLKNVPDNMFNVQMTRK